jgi:hypothetical protein
MSKKHHRTLAETKTKTSVIREQPQKTPAEFFNAILVFFATYFIYLLTVYPTVGTEDSGELIGAAVLPDIAHPPGYPLHTILGFIFSKIIFFGNMGWRVNLLSAFMGAAAVAILYLIIKRITKSTAIGIVAALFFAFTDIFWSQAIRTEIYTIDIFFLSLISYLLLLWDETQENKYLYWTAFTYGLSWTDSFMMMLLLGPPIVIFALIRNWKIILKPKLIILCLLSFAAGLTPYIYLPLRTWLAPYNNPAFIKHDGLYTWDTFFAFVNRNIYGGTMNSIGAIVPAVKEKVNPFLAWFIGIGQFAISYAQRFWSGVSSGFLLMSKIIIEQLLYLPVLLLVPGFYYLKKTRFKYLIYVISCLFFYTAFQLTYIIIKANMDPYNIHNNRPFYTSAIFVMTLLVLPGLALVFENLKKIEYKKIFFILLIIIPILPLIVNFWSNNESGNYLAYDFNKNALKSLPQNAFMLSIGKDNSTFPLYYLTKVEKYRPDVNVEIYYYAPSPAASFIEKKQAEKKQTSLFIDLLPSNYKAIGLTPYNFVFQYGADQSLPPADFSKFTLRGMREKMDYPNTKLKGIYYLKAALSGEDAEKVTYFLDKVIRECSQIQWQMNFVQDFLDKKFITGMFI